MSPVTRSWQRALNQSDAAKPTVPDIEPRLVGRWGICSKNRLGLITGRKQLPWGMSWVGVGIDGKQWASRNPVILIDQDEKVLNSLAEVLELQLTLSIQRTCKHEAERIIDCIGTDSDTEIQKFYCPDCERVRTDEVVGSKVRADAEMEP